MNPFRFLTIDANDYNHNDDHDDHDGGGGGIFRYVCLFVRSLIFVARSKKKKKKATIKKRFDSI